MAKRRYSPRTARFSRAWWWRTVRSLFWIVLITLLIWVYADMKFNDTRALTTKVRLTPPKAGDLVILSPSPADVHVRFELEGSRESLDAFQAQLKDLIDYELRNVQAGLAQIPTRDILTDAAGIVEAGLRLVSAQPSVINLRLDSLERRELPVELVYSDVELTDPPAVRMDVTAAHSQWEQILARQPSPALKTVNRSLKTFETGKPVLVEFQLAKQIAGVAVRPDKETISVQVTIRQRTDKKTLTVTVMVQTPPDWQDTWQEFALITRDPLEWRPQITVTGAIADLDRLEAKNIDAYIVLADDDKKPVESWLARQAQIRFPPNLDVRLEGERPTVHFRLERRAGLETAP